MLLFARKAPVLATVLTATVITATVLTAVFMHPVSPAWAESEESQDLSEAKALRDTPPEDLFALRLIIPDREIQQPQVEVIVQAYNPYTSAPIVDLPVTLDVTLVEDDMPDAEPSRHTVRTGVDGTTSLPIALPTVRAHSAELYVDASATYRGATQSVESEIYFYDLEPHALISTDRKLYQPGQTVHIRGLWLDSSQRPMSNQSVLLEIQDSRERRVARVELTTSDLGIASFDWPIPQSARPDDYTIQARPDARFRQAASFGVRPYEPSTLWLEAHPRQAMLLPGDVAVVDVEARYTHGAPLAHADVELFYVSKKHQMVKGSQEPVVAPSTLVQTDAQGRATARLDLTNAFEDVPFHRHSRDLPFRVEVRDPVTQRSESVDLELRLSHQEVHVYSVGSVRDGLPHDTYVIAQWADGEPFSGWISVERAYFQGAAQQLGRVYTDAYGFASTSHLNLDTRHHYRLLALSDTSTDTPLGSSRAYWHSQNELQLLNARPLARAGEPLQVDLQVARPMSHLGIFVLDAEGKLLAQQTLPTLESSIQLVFPYQESFQGLLSVLALSLSPDLDDAWDMPATRCHAIYPRAVGDRLQLAASARRDVYRPGETAHLELALHHAQGSGSVAVAIVDRATEARQASLGLGGDPALFAPLQRSYVTSDPYDLHIGAWSLHRLLRLPEAERYGDSAQQVARALFASTYFNAPDTETSDPLDRQRAILKPLLERDDAVRDALSQLERKHPEHVVDLPTFDQALYELGIDLDTLRDPWGRAYRVVTSIRRNRRYFEVMSNGRDGEPQTVDDFTVWTADWPYAHRLGQALEHFAKTHPTKAHRVLSDAALRNAAMAEQGFLWEAQKDPWGQSYDLRWSLEGRHLRYRLVSRGPDGVWQPLETEGTPRQHDDLTVSSFRLPFAAHEESRLRATLRTPFWNGLLPSTVATFRQHLQQQGLDVEAWVGPWGHPMYFTLHNTSTFIDAWTMDDKGRKTLLPREQIFDIVRLWSVGSDGIQDTADDLELTDIRRPRYGYQDYLKRLGADPPEPGSPNLLGDEGVLAGTVFMLDGFPVPGVLITAISHRQWKTISVDDGSFQLTLPTGSYIVLAELEGFATLQATEVWILPGQQFHLALQMDVEDVEENIVVTGESPNLSFPVGGAEPLQPSPRRSTPRLRKDFPETLFWLADGRVDDDGRLHLEVPLADNLTRWHLAALASDAAGRLATAELDVTVTQPFFLLPDLPPHLTAGDVLQLPVDIHNRTGGPVPVDLTLVELPPSDDAEPEATPSWSRPLTAKDGIHRVVSEQTFDQVGRRNLRWTATSLHPSETGDAVQKSTEVSWHGARHVTTQSQLVNGRSGMQISLPEGALPGSGRLDVLIYEDLESHLLGVLQGLAKKPTGCAEQTTSSAWIHVLLLDRWIKNGAGDTEPAQASRQHALDALAGLSAFRTDGGFGYWRGNPKADLALTAYVLEFLLAASEHLPVDLEMLNDTAAFLRRQRTPSGRWPQTKTWLQSTAAELLHLRTEALATHALALHGVGRSDEASLEAAFSSLQRLHGELGEDPYGLALLTSTGGMLQGQSMVESRIVADIVLDTAKRLLGLAQPSEGSLTWHLRSNTPFYGWGRAGRLSSTALATRALASLQDTGLIEAGSPFADAVQSATGGGLSYLLLNKETDGTWFTTQSSVRSLRALDAVLSSAPGPGSGPDSAPSLDGRAMVRSVDQTGFGGPRRWTLPLSEGTHQLTVPATNRDGSWRLVQTRVHSHLPWYDDRATPHSGDLAFDVQCSDADSDQGTPLRRGDTATCDIEIARVGYRGSGMLVAEIGLPPGAEVDEAALHEARQNRYIDDFEVWPGRVVLYVWPGYENPTVRLTLPWRPRLALRAATQPSVLYDYYNPDARVVLPPRDVVVEGDRQNGI